MSTRLSRPRRVGVLVATALAIALAVPAATFADTTAAPQILPASSRGATIHLAARGTINARLIATVRLEITCEPFEILDWQTGETVESTQGSVEWLSLTMLQASGKTVNWGTADGGLSQPVTCDGQTVTALDMAVVPQIAPWKSGVAVAGAVVSIASPDFMTADFASSGPVQVRLSK
jgi:hypothetical protein